jgi:hypothetical protein
MATPKRLQLRFHGRVIDHLGIQMYQSPVAAVAELIANAWDADAESVMISLPETLSPDAEIVITDFGDGMTFDECQDRYLNVGYNRRQGDPNQRSARKKRPILGRKGIGKFAGFGIADCMVISTTSRATGERTVFALEIDKLRGEGEYIATSPAEIEPFEYLEPDDDRTDEHGTIIHLKALKVARRPSVAVFRKSMARRFLLHERVADFEILVNGQRLPPVEGEGRVEFDFPRDLLPEERPKGLSLDDDWGVEAIGPGQVLRWRVAFYESPIDDEELTGVAVFAHGKLAQVPFFFNLTGGLGGQHGQQYLSGQVEADYLDEQAEDLIATERQRINWQDPASLPLLNWGQERIKWLLRTWQDRRAAKKYEILENRLAPFADRLARFPKHEQRVVERALKNMARLTSLSDEQYVGLGESVLVAWEGGRLKDLIDAIALAGDLSETELLEILVEAGILTALHTAEAIKAKLQVIRGLRSRIEARELENAVRDYIARHPWLVGPRWDTFRREVGVGNLIRAARTEARMDDAHEWPGRIDLALSSGPSLVILEFMRPGMKVDWDHVHRFERYILALRRHVAGITGGPFNHVTGYIVADELLADPTLTDKLQRLAGDEMYALDWKSLLEQAAAQWREFLDVLLERTPGDARLKALAEPTAASRLMGGGHEAADEDDD